MGAALPAGAMPPPAYPAAGPMGMPQAQAADPFACLQPGSAQPAASGAPPAYVTPSGYGSYGNNYGAAMGSAPQQAGLQPMAAQQFAQRGARAPREVPGEEQPATASAAPADPFANLAQF